MHIKEPQTPQLPAPKAGGSEGKRGDLRRTLAWEITPGVTFPTMVRPRAIEPTCPLLGGGTSAREGGRPPWGPVPLVRVAPTNHPVSGGAVALAKVMEGFP